MNEQDRMALVALDAARRGARPIFLDFETSTSMVVDRLKAVRAPRKISGVLVPTSAEERQALDAEAEALAALSPADRVTVTHRFYRITTVRTRRRDVPGCITGVAEHTTRNGMFTRAKNPVATWLNSRDGIAQLGGRRDLIRGEDREMTVYEWYDEYGTYERGRHDPWVAGEVIPRSEKYERDARRQPPYRETERPWSSHKGGMAHSTISLTRLPRSS